MKEIKQWTLVSSHLTFQHRVACFRLPYGTKVSSSYMYMFTASSVYFVGIIDF
jgi:hypothetical protein